jgi:hypothetical protein
MIGSVAKPHLPLLPLVNTHNHSIVSPPPVPPPPPSKSSVSPPLLVYSSLATTFFPTPSLPFLTFLLVSLGSSLPPLR